MDTLRLTVLLALFAGTLCAVGFEIEPIDMASTKLTVTEAIFKNLKDHFSKRQLGTFDQRYWEMMDYWNASEPRAILYICGESTGRFPAEKSLPVVAAQQLKAAVFSLEHRYYGKSQPADDWSVDNLEFLTHEQALADIAYFIESTNKRFNETQKTVPKWVVIGGSYAGAMSAWFRYKYPHLAVGSIASSAVVYAVADFPEFENQTVKNLKKCEGEPVGWAVQLLRSYQVYADSQLFSSNPEDTKTFLSMFNATDMTYMDFAYYFADLPVAYTQSGLRRRLLCPILADLKKSGLPVKEQVKKFADTTAAYGFTAEKYKFARLQNITIDFAKSSRQWYYQVCTAFGWLQSSYAANPIRWTGMNLTYWYRYCHKAYNDIILPDDIRTNVYTSGDMLGKFATNTYFSNGQDDGWQYASLTDNEYNNQRIVVKMINCDDCAHCMDLKTSNDNDPQELKDTRAEEIKKMLEWFGTAQ